jgi:hypothetical protein
VYPRDAMCSAALNLTPLSMWAPALSRVPRPWTSVFCQDGLWRCHVSCTSGPLLRAKEGLDVVAYPMALDPTSLLGWDLMLPCAPQLSVDRWPQI